MYLKLTGSVSTGFKIDEIIRDEERIPWGSIGISADEMIEYVEVETPDDADGYDEDGNAFAYTGDLFNKVTFYGPFADIDDALTWGEEELGSNWDSVEYKKPDLFLRNKP